MVELVAVIALIGVIGIYAAPRFFNANLFRSRGYLDELLAATRYAQKLAVASGCEAQIIINTNNFLLQQPQAAGLCGTLSGPWQQISLPGKAPPFTAPAGVTTNSTTITFLPSGRANAVANVDVTVNGTPTFTVHAATGFVERL